MGRNKTPLLALAALLLGGSLVAYVALGGIEKNLVYYLAPDELLAKGVGAHGANVRLGGLVQRGSVRWQPDSMQLAFRLGLRPDGEPAVAVQAHGAPPQMFQEGIGAVVEGQFDGQTFRAERVLVKHSNEYRPPAPGERPEQVYGALVPSVPPLPNPVGGTTPQQAAPGMTPPPPSAAAP